MCIGVAGWTRLSLASSNDSEDNFTCSIRLEKAVTIASRIIFNVVVWCFTNALVIAVIQICTKGVAVSENESTNSEKLGFG